MRLDPILLVMEDRADREVVLEFLEGLFDFRELHVLVPQLGQIGVGEVGAQQVAALATKRLPQPVEP